MRIDGGSDISGAVTATIVAAITLVMALVGLVAAAGFVVVAQRRQRQLGPVVGDRRECAAAAARDDRERRDRGNGRGHRRCDSRRHRLVRNRAVDRERGSNHRIDRFALPWALMATTLLIAVVMATAAAWWPARVVSRLSVMAALSGRPSRPRPVHRSLVLAFALVVCGVGAIAAARPTSDHVRPLVLIAGLLAVVVGVVFVSPAAVRALAVPARRLPFAPRLALRDLARYQARAAAALAAITLGLGISVAVVAIAGANEYRSDEGNLSAQQLLIRFDDPAETSSPDPTTSELRGLDARAATVAAAIGSDAEVVPLDYAMNPATSTDPNVREPIAVGAPKDADTTKSSATPTSPRPRCSRTTGSTPRRSIPRRTF